MSDGYSFTDTIRSEKFKTCSANQIKLNQRLKEIAAEMANLPKPPRRIEDWVDGWADLSIKRNFSMESYDKHIKFRKEYHKLVDTADSNLREMKLLVIEDLLEKINSTLEKGKSEE